MSHYRPGYFWLVERSRRLGYDSRAIIERYDEHVEDVLVNVALRAVAALARAAARASAALVRRAPSAPSAALLERCWDERRGLFFDLAGRDERPVRRLDLVVARPARAALAARRDRAAG